MSSAAAAQVRAVIEPLTAARGIDLEDVVVRSAGSRRLVQVLVDRDGGIDLDGVAEVSRSCSEALDAADVFAGAYVLEVSSPGVDRPLTQPRHWRRNVGRLVQARLADGGTVTGRLTSAGDDSVTLAVGSGQRTFAYGELSRGVVQVEFSRPGYDETDDEEAAR
jgi:ribosome maturation factor RimP